MTDFDRVIDELTGRVASLDRRRQAAFFAACGEALFPLYERFTRETGWGDVKTLRKGLDIAWRYAEDGTSKDVEELLRDLESATPHADDFDNLISTYAQDAIICVDTALRATSSKEKVEPACVEYALEPTKVS